MISVKLEYDHINEKSMQERLLAGEMIVCDANVLAFRRENKKDSRRLRDFFFREVLLQEP